VTAVRLRRALVVVALLPIAACSLPLPGEVRPVGEGAAGQPVVAPLQVIPPRPNADATPVEAVLGFLGAQASTEGDHAIARQFLTDGGREHWRDEANVVVYDPDTLELQQAPGTGAGALVRVVSRVSGVVRGDGSYLARPDVTVSESYRLVRAGNRWLIDELPAGLRLTAADLRRSFAPHPVFYVAPAYGSKQRHLVPDLVFLPVDADLGRSLVQRLLRAPSQALLGSVSTAIPSGTRVHRFSVSAAGVVTLDLTGMTTVPTGVRAQDLSAQLVWTLRSLGATFRGVRVLMDGSPLAVPNASEVQEAGSWAGYDPQGLGTAPPYFYVAGRRLRSSTSLPPSVITSTDLGDRRAIPVDAVAVTPDQTRVAVLERSPSGSVAVRVGLLRGTAFPVVARAPGLTSPSWGAGNQGVWLVRNQRSLVRVDDRLRDVPVAGLPTGRLTSVAVSRDGARVALVVGGRLYVGRVDVVGGRVQVVGLALVLPALHQASHVAWSASTELVVLGVLRRSVQVVQVAVDGSSSQVLNVAGLVPTQVAASPAGVLVVAGDRLYLSTGAEFRQVQNGTVTGPAYPG
jgi:hypothetical protein